MSSYISRLQIKIFQYGAGFSEKRMWETEKSVETVSLAAFRWKVRKDNRIITRCFFQTAFAQLSHILLFSCEGVRAGNIWIFQVVKWVVWVWEFFMVILIPSFPVKNINLIQSLFEQTGPLRHRAVEGKDPVQLGNRVRASTQFSKAPGAVPLL